LGYRNFLDIIEEKVSAFEGESNILSNICDFVGSVSHIPYCASITFRDEDVMKAK
jgi:5,10-methenyltetrahydromethanopterin hydrogenase